jgi:hypothetical protein
VTSAAGPPVPPATSTATPQEAPTIRRSRRWVDFVLAHRWWAGITGFLTVAALVAATIPIFRSDPPGQGQSTSGNQNCVVQGQGNVVTCGFGNTSSKQSGTGTIAITVTPAKEPVTSFILPIDVPLESFPPEMSNGCDTKQLVWLRRYGRELREDYSVKLKNTAATDAMITLDNIRVENPSAAEVPTALRFFCPDQGEGDVTQVMVDLDRGGSVSFSAYHGAEKPGSLFAFNLSPGEQGGLDFRITGAASAYSGRLVADVSGPDGKLIVPIPVEASDGSFSRPGAGKGSAFRVYWGGTGIFYCSFGAVPNSIRQRTPSQIRSTLTELARGKCVASNVGNSPSGATRGSEAGTPCGQPAGNTASASPPPNCSDAEARSAAESLGSHLQSHWPALAHWSTAPDFEPYARPKVEALVKLCGKDWAILVVEDLNVTGPTWRAMSNWAEVAPDLAQASAGASARGSS